MPRITSTEVRCGNADCGKWFASPIAFGDLESFQSLRMSGNRAQCPRCGKMTDCNKENMRVTTDDGQVYVGGQAQ